MKRLGPTTCLALCAFAVTSAPAGAQGLGDLIPGETVERTVEETVRPTVQDVVEAPLPEPVEDVVADSPVAPVREEVRQVVRDTVGTGGGGGGGNNGGGGTGSGTGTGSGAGSGSGGGGDPAGGGGTDTAGGGSPGRSGERPRAPRERGAGQGGPGTAAGAAGGAGGLPADGDEGATSDGNRNRSSGAGEGTAEPDRGAVVQTVDRIVRAIPTPIWVALGVLLGMALALGGRVVVERRRARALALDREQLQREVEALERTLLPAVPEQVGGVATSVAYRSDGPAAGGDFYDAMELPDGRAVVLVGDVSGHGAEALESTNLVRTHLHALLEDGMSPRAALAEVGRRAPAWLDGRLTTVVVAAHDPAAGTLTYATAGHPAPIVAGPGAAEPITACGSPPLGADVPTGLRETTLPFPPGSLACFFTDGLIEARAGHGMVGRERLAELVAALGPDDGADALLELVVAVADETPDDMAVCLLRPLTEHPVLLSNRVEVLELEVGDVESGIGQRFLEACQVPTAEMDATLEQARAAAAMHGRVLVEVTMTGDVGRARVGGTPLILA